MPELASYDLIFMDCQMPELDGYAAARETRRRETGGRQGVAIVAMTAEAWRRRGKAVWQRAWTSTSLNLSSWKISSKLCRSGCLTRRP